MQARRRQNPAMWELFLQKVPFSESTLSIIQHGSKYIFIDGPPPTSQPAQNPDRPMTESEMVAVMEIILENLDKNHFCGPFPGDCRETVKGDKLFFSNVFPVLKKTLKNGKKCYRMVLDGSPFSEKMLKKYKEIYLCQFLPVVELTLRANYL